MNGQDKHIDHPDSRPLVVCLHSSASNGGQWRAFRQSLRGRCRVFTPDHVGYGSRRFQADRKFTIQQEVDAVLEQIGDLSEPFHLVGHSYGGAVATYLAKRYPERVRSLVLYEPANFAVLFADQNEADARREILDVRRVFAAGSGTAMSRWRAARSFIAYWSGMETWRKFNFAKRSWIASIAPKVRAEFDAILGAHEALSDVSDLSMPVRLICGTKTTYAARRVSEIMAKQIPDARLLKLVNLRHMAPVTDPESVNPLLIDFVTPATEASAATAGPRCA